MERNKITENTKVKELLEDYPWLLDEAIKLDERFKMVNSPMGRILLKKATLVDLAKLGNLNVEDVVKEIEKMIENHEEEKEEE